MKKKTKIVSEQGFWNKWFNMHELDQEKYIQKLVPIIEQHFKSLETIKVQVGDKEVLRLKAALLNSYFVDLLRAYEEKKNKK